VNRATFRVIRAGPHVSIQDMGRPGLMRFGVPASGPMDRIAFATAQSALGCAPMAPGVEVSLGGLVLECTGGQVTVAVAGGGFVVGCGPYRLGSWSVVPIERGQRLAICPGPWGSWACLAFAGTLDAREWLGSVSTHSPSGQGGGHLEPGMELVVEDARLTETRPRALVCPVTARPRRRVAVVLGPQQRYFPPEAISALLDGRFVLTDAYDRMGVRLGGPAPFPEGALSIPSGPVVRGSIQVSGDGVATVLLADHQTTGGYPRIATILDDDLDGFVQLRPREAVRFYAVTADEAIQRARQRAVARTRYLASVRAAAAQ
jgi:allophanate hydrolase